MFFLGGSQQSKKGSLCAPLLDTQGSICSPLTGCVTPLPNPATYATKVGAKGTGRLLLTKLGLFRLRRSGRVSEIMTKKAPRPRIQYVVRRFIFPVSGLKDNVQVAFTSLRKYETRSNLLIENGQAFLLVSTYPVCTFTRPDPSRPFVLDSLQHH